MKMLKLLSNQISHFQEHINRIHRGIVYKCDICDYQTGSDKNLKGINIIVYLPLIYIVQGVQIKLAVTLE